MNRKGDPKKNKKTGLLYTFKMGVLDTIDPNSTNFLGTRSFPLNKGDSLNLERMKQLSQQKLCFNGNHRYISWLTE